LTIKKEKFHRNWVDWCRRGIASNLPAFVSFCPKWQVKMSNFTQAFAIILEETIVISNYNVKKLHSLTFKNLKCSVDI
jgi:hypothetical protein